IPALKQLRKAYPNTELHLVCRKGLGSIIKAYGLADQVHDNFLGTKPTLKEWKERFKNKHFDFLICPHESTRSKLLSFFTKADKKIGYSSFLGSFIFTEHLDRPMHLPEALRQLYLIKSLIPGLSLEMSHLPNTFKVYDSIPMWASMNMYHQGQKRELKEKFCKTWKLDATKKIIAIAPGSVWPTKRWPVEEFVRVAQKFIDLQEVVVIVGSKDEKKFGEHIFSQVPQVMDLCGKTNLVELTEVLAACDLLISNDSGSMHMAATTNTPIVTVFGPTVLDFGYQPWSNDFEVVETKGLKCRPCTSHGGAVCPIGTHECMKMIRSDRVITASGTFLDIK
ncbi:MAG: glycosyltransferase family 9 protein, partial [Bdellovibrionaceae bacterium]|nr:glycosyltransferase family 9 protein [Pseudobdellovibrionaceae bacterium]